MYQIILHKEVGDEVEHAYTWHESKHQGIGDRLLAEIEAGFNSIVENPMQWSGFGARSRRYVLPNFPYSIIYHGLGDAVLVLAIMHHRQKPGYWRKRNK